MQEKPDKEELLAAVATFLLAEVKPVIADARLSFRVLIASSLAQIVANELRSGTKHDEAELARLKQILDGKTDDLRALEAELAQRLREGTLAPTKEVREHLRETLRDQLAVNNPFFDTRPEIEK